MPELPEVETVKNDLLGLIRGDTIISVKVLDPCNLRDISQVRFNSILRNKRIESIFRLGKMLHFSLNLEYALLVHLKMTGRFYCPSNRNDLDSHTRIIFKMKKKGLLAFADIRKFGVIYLIKKDKVKEFPYIQRLGIDPLSKQYSLKVFKEALKKYQQKTLKALLLEQSFVAGIGNIYAAEILFKSRLSPLRKVNSLKVKEVALLFRNIKGILLTAIKYRGTTSSDFRDVDGKSGGFQNILKVYGREDEKCLLCKSKIERIVQNGRSTFYCRKCQK